jgi:predicted transcriptional regulator
MGINRLIEVRFLREKQVELFKSLPQTSRLKSTCDKIGLSYTYSLQLIKCWQKSGLIVASRVDGGKNMFSYTEKGKKFSDWFKEYENMLVDIYD